MTWRKALLIVSAAGALAFVIAVALTTNGESKCVEDTSPWDCDQ